MLELVFSGVVAFSAALLKQYCSLWTAAWSIFFKWK